MVEFAFGGNLNGIGSRSEVKQDMTSHVFKDASTTEQSFFATLLYFILYLFLKFFFPNQNTTTGTTVRSTTIGSMTTTAFNSTPNCSYFICERNIQSCLKWTFLSVISLKILKNSLWKELLHTKYKNSRRSDCHGSFVARPSICYIRC
jgi:hypothetical protein